MYQLFYLIGITILAAINFFTFYLLYLFIKHRYNITRFTKELYELAKIWNVLYFFRKWNYKWNEPKIPADKKIQLGNCTIYLAHLTKNINRKRLLLEILCYIDLYYYSKKQKYIKIQKPEPNIITAISEQAYIEVQWLLRSKQQLDIQFQQAIEEYLPKIRWTEDALKLYNPNSEYIYFSYCK